MLYLRKLVSIRKYFILFFTIFFISCGGNKNTGINLVYIFDISGSYYQGSLRPSVKLAENIFTDITSTEGLPYYPQTHQVSTIEEMSVAIGGLCATKIKEGNIFEEQSYNPKDQFDACLQKVMNASMARSTDIRGALLTASKSLQNKELYGRGVIIFSDMQEVINERRQYDIDLSGIPVYVIYEWSKQQLQNPSMQRNDRQYLESLLDQAGCPSYSFKPLTSVITDPDMVRKFFRRKF